MVRCDALGRIPGLAHAWSTRRDAGTDDFDLGGSDDTPAREARRRRFLAAVGFGDARAVLARQVHGSRIARAVEGSSPEADGLVWEGADPVVACVLTADCVPLLLADREHPRAAAVHAGWRGTAAGIAEAAVAALGALGSPARRLVAALGPAILGCCYEVGTEVVAAVASRTGSHAQGVASRSAGDRFFVDLQEANRRQLVAAGVPSRAIVRAPWCTRCHPGLFFSFRRDGRSAGRHMAAIGAIAPP